MTDVENLAEIINDFFGCDAAYFDINPFDLATHLINAGVTLSTSSQAKAEVEKTIIKHGHWIYKPYECDDTVWLFHCSTCGTPNARERSYCSTCGTYMDSDTINYIVETGNLTCYNNTHSEGESL